MPTPRQDLRKSHLQGDNMDYMSQSTSNLPDFQDDRSFSFSVKTFSQSFEDICCFENNSERVCHDDTECLTSNNNVKGRTKNFESFLMTGERMINMAKTPANHDFRHSGGCSRRSSLPTNSNAAKTLHMDSSFTSLERVDKETRVSHDARIEKRLTVPIQSEELRGMLEMTSQNNMVENQSETEDSQPSREKQQYEVKNKLASNPPSLSPESSFSEDLDIGNVLNCSPLPDAIDVPSARRLAKRLFNLEGFSKTDVSRHLSKNDYFNKYVAEEYCKFFSFTDLNLDVALRKFLVKVVAKFRSCFKNS